MSTFNFISGQVTIGTAAAITFTRNAIASFDDAFIMVKDFNNSMLYIKDTDIVQFNGTVFNGTKQQIVDKLNDEILSEPSLLLE